jgi:mRNA-degrading endonuclease toxin of MazEF toxin-antitoxin module
VVNASQILTLNKDELERLVGAVPARWMDRVDAGLRWFMALE